jgi:hypothetical protein
MVIVHTIVYSLEYIDAVPSPDTFVNGSGLKYQIDTPVG